MHTFILFALLAGCASSQIDDSAHDLDAADDSPVDASPGMTDASPEVDAMDPAVRIRRLVWSWPACATAGPVAPPLTLAVLVEVSPDLPTVAITGMASGCDPFAERKAIVTCYPTVPPTGRVLSVRAALGSGLPHDVATPIEDCVDGELTFPPDDDGDAH